MPGPSSRQKQSYVDRLEVAARRQDFAPLERGLQAFPVGSIFLTTSDQSPASLLGYGIWERFAEGRVLVGIHPSDPLFNNMGETGGEQLHVLTPSEVP